MTNEGWIGVDLDGTLAEYHGWAGVDHIGKPVPEMVARVKRWRAQGREVRIFTARVDGGPNVRDVARARMIIVAWCVEVFGEVLLITNEKDYGMIRLYDDRAVQVEENTGRLLTTAPHEAEMFSGCGHCGGSRLCSCDQCQMASHPQACQYCGGK